MLSAYEKIVNSIAIDVACVCNGAAGLLLIGVTVDLKSLAWRKRSKIDVGRKAPGAAVDDEGRPGV